MTTRAKTTSRAAQALLALSSVFSPRPTAPIPPSNIHDPIFAPTDPPKSHDPAPLDEIVITTACDSVSIGSFYHNHLSASSSTSSGSTSSAILRQELADREISHAWELEQLQQELIQARQVLATPQPPIPSARHAPRNTADRPTVTQTSIALQTSQFYTTQKVWEPLSEGADFELWQASIISTIKCDPHLHVLFNSHTKTLVQSTTDIALDQYLYHKLSLCLKTPATATFLKRTGLGGNGVALFWTLDSAFVDRSRAHRQTQITTFLTTFHRDVAAQENVDVYYNRFSHLVHQIKSGENGISIHPTEIRERFLTTLGGHYDYLAEALERNHLDPFYLDCSDEALLLRLRNVRPRGTALAIWSDILFVAPV